MGAAGICVRRSHANNVNVAGRLILFEQHAGNRKRSGSRDHVAVVSKIIQSAVTAAQTKKERKKEKEVCLLSLGFFLWWSGFSLWWSGSTEEQVNVHDCEY
jgi:hypothetical protein